MKRLADIAIDADGDELVFRVKLARSLRSILGALLEPIGEPAAPPQIARKAPAAKPAKKTPDKSKHEQARDEFDRAITERYLSEDAPSIADCGVQFRVGKERVLGALARTGTATRRKGRAAGVAVADLRVKRQAKREALEPKPKPLAIPANVNRRQYEPPPAPTGKTASKEAYRKSMARHFKSKKIDLTPAEQQALIDKHFANGGAITEVPAALADGSLRYQSNAGTGYGGGGRKRGAS